MKTETRDALGPVGAYSFALDRLPTAEAVEVARAIEKFGFGSLWIAEGAASREALSHASILLAGTSTLVVGTGIASIWARDPTAMASGWRTLSDAYPGRFVLGMGVSHTGAVGRRGHDYGSRPFSTMRGYLDEMDSANLLSPVPKAGQTRVLAALRPRMLQLAAERTDGAHTYFVPPDHTHRARSLIGAEPLLVVQQAVVLEEDPSAARQTARKHTSHYLGRENYRNNLCSLGIDEAEMEGGGSDRLVDAVIAWGSEERIGGRIEEQRAAGADHVVIQPVGGETGTGPLISSYERIAAILNLTARRRM
jgi:probable F420-dependent oxidoreductase